MLRRFRDTEEFSRPARSLGLELQPAFDADIAREAQRRQKRVVERAYVGQAAHPEIDMIVSSSHRVRIIAEENGVEGGGGKEKNRVFLRTGSAQSTVLNRIAPGHGA